MSSSEGKDPREGEIPLSPLLLEGPALIPVPRKRRLGFRDKDEPHRGWGVLGWGYILLYYSKPLGRASHPEEAGPSAYPWVGFPRAKCL